MKTVLVVEGNEQDHRALQTLLQDHGYTVNSASGKTLQVSKVPQGADPGNRPGAADEAIDVTEPPQGAEQHYRDVYESAPIGIFRSSIPGKLLGVNPACASMLQFDSPQDMIETVNRAGIAESLYFDANHREEILAEVLGFSGWHVFEEKFRCKDGSLIDCFFHLRAVRDAEGRPLEFEGFVQDNSDRRQAEKELAVSSSKCNRV